MSSLNLSLVTGHETIGADTGATGGTTVTGSVTAHTKGAWAQLVASSAAAASWIEVIIGFPSVGAQQYMVDIGVGGAGSEAVLLPNLHFEGISADSGTAHYIFPVAIAAGTRVSARCQSNSGGSDTIQVMAILWKGDAGGFAAPGSVAAYGVATASTSLTAVDPGGTANTKSAWVQMTASTGIDIRWLMFCVSRGGSSTSASTRYLVDIGTGGAGSETVLVANAFAVAAIAGDYAIPRTFGFAVDIPSGTRIAARIQSSSTVSGDRVLDVAVYGANAADVASGGGQHAHAGWGG